MSPSGLVDVAFYNNLISAYTSRQGISTLSLTHTHRLATPLMIGLFISTNQTVHTCDLFLAIERGGRVTERREKEKKNKKKGIKPALH